ncbi:MAG: pantetheine-phosphate adenylyltransferase [Pseudomonadota bacterium]
MAKARIAVYPGTFDPVTNGHMDIIVRAVTLVDQLIVGVAVNAGKGPLFGFEERVELLNGEIMALDPQLGARIEVQPFKTLLMHFAKTVGADVIVRGLRAVSDFEYEFQMAAMNRRLSPGVDTVFLMASETNQFISSRFVKEIARLGGDISHFVSPRVVRKVKDSLARAGGAGEGEGAATIPLPAVKAPI